MLTFSTLVAFQSDLLPGISKCPSLAVILCAKPNCPDSVPGFQFYDKLDKFCQLCSVCPDDCEADPCSKLRKGGCYTAPFFCDENDAE